MSSTVVDTVQKLPILDGTNYKAWSSALKSHLMSKGLWMYVSGDEEKPEDIITGSGDTATTTPADPVLLKAWMKDDQMAMGHITIHLTATIRELVSSKETSKDIWDILKTQYSKQGTSAIYADFKMIMDLTIPANNHPGPAIDKMIAAFDRLQTNKVEVSDKLQALMIMSKIPPAMTMITQLSAAAALKELSFQGIAEKILLDWQRRSSEKNKSSAPAPSAQKISSVKRKNPDPNFKDQQQQSASQGNSAQDQQGGGKGRRGKRAGRGRGKGKGQGNDHHAHLLASSVVIPTRIVDSPSKVDPRPSLSPNVTGMSSSDPSDLGGYVDSGYATTKAAFGLAHDLNVRTSCERVKYLENVITGTSDLKLTANGDIDMEEHARIPKRQRLINRIDWIARDNDSISIGDEDEYMQALDACDDAPLSDLDDDIAEAAGFNDLYRRVPSPKHDPLTDAPLAARTVLIKSCVVASLPNICAHSLLFAACNECKGKEKEVESSHSVWMLDSGASRHFTWNMDDFVDFEYLSEPIVATTANGVAHITGKGTVLLNAPVNSDARDFEKHGAKFSTVKLHPVYFMPELTTRLLSLGQFLRDGLTVQGSLSQLVLFTQKRERFLVFERQSPEDTLYYIASPPRNDVMNIFSTTHLVDYELMHRRFAHPSREVLRNAEKHTRGFPRVEFPLKDPICSGCAKGKMANRSFPPSTDRASHVFQRIHSDVKSWPISSYHKFQYTVTFLDDYSSHAWVQHLTKKSGVIHAFKNFLAMVKTQYNTGIKEWMSDAGGEYKSEAFNQLLRENGIRILQSAPHTPQQNGRAERLNRTLTEKGESMRHLACLPDSWWEFSITHATHVYNRTPNRRLDWRTPYELVNGQPPAIDHLRVLGCGAYVHLPNDVRPNKLTPRAELMVYLGVAPGGHGDLFMRSPNNTVFTAAHALFDEGIFPRCPKFTKPRESTQLRRPFSEQQDPHPYAYLPGQDDDDIPHHPPTLPERRQELDRDDDREQQTPPRENTPPPRTPSPRNPAPVAPPPAPLRRSQREPKQVVRPDNVYGQRKPTQIFKDVEKESVWKKMIGEKPSRPRAPKSKQKQVPGPSQPAIPPQEAPSTHDRDESPTAEPSDEDDMYVDDDETAMAKLCREGGADLIHFLLNAAVPPSEKDLPKVREWTFRDIARLPKAEQHEWRIACREELEALQRRDVYELVERPKGRTIIKNRWVFDVKTDGRKKARLVGKGFSQVEGMDYDQIFSPVVRFETVRLILAISALESWHISGLDVRNAYLYGILDEEIYMEQPEGFIAKGQERKVLRLKRALYGLKQAGLAWWRALNKSMVELGFKRLSADAGIFVYKAKDGRIVVAVIYVDDALFCGRDKSLIDELKAKFMKKWECRDLGETKEFLRMRIDRSGGKVKIDQCAYLDTVLQRFGMQNAKTAPTPLPAGYMPEPNTAAVDSNLRTRFQTVIGSLLYIMLGTRPDISYAVTKLSKHAANPSADHLAKALYICRYLAGTKNYSMVYNGATGLGLNACTDSDWGSDPHSQRRSQSGYFLKLADACISWTSRTQKTIAHSVTEAEYMSLSDCSRQVVWVRNLLQEIGYNLGPIPIAGDNQGSIFIASNPVTEKRSKHIDIRYHYIREVIEDKLVEVFYIEGENNPADMFTKNLAAPKFTKFRALLGLEFH